MSTGLAEAIPAHASTPSVTETATTRVRTSDPPSSFSGPARRRNGRQRRFLQLVVVDHPVDEAVLDRLIGLEEAVALHVGVDLLEALPGVLGVDLIDPPADVEDLLGVDRDVGGLALEAGRGLVDEDPAVGQ